MNRARSDSLQLVGGYHAGPLFIFVVQRPAKDHDKREIEGYRVRQRTTPEWADRFALRAKWRESTVRTLETGVQHSVDHIVPLRHPLVCGLHVEQNLRVIPLVENVKKSNRYWPDMWGEQMELELR